MTDKMNVNAVDNTAMENDEFDFDFSSTSLEETLGYDNEGACAELAKDMKRGDNLSLRFYKDNEGYQSVQVESKNVASYKVRLNKGIFSWLIRYIEEGVADYAYDPKPMDPITADVEQHREDMLRLFVKGGKRIQWVPQFRERNGRINGTYIAKNGKVFFYVKRTDELIDWLREMKQAI